MRRFEDGHAKRDRLDHHRQPIADHPGAARLRRALFLLFPVMLASPALAQSDSDAQGWITLGASGKIADHVTLSAEAVGRFGDNADGLYEAEFGGSLGYDIGGGVTLSAGYTRVPGYADGHATKIEDRPRQQVDFGIATFGGGALAGRARLEERFLDTGSDVGLRLRPSIKYTRPFHAGGKTALVISHESFVQLNTTDWGQRSGYSRMRNAIGVKTPIAARLTGELDYLNQYDFGFRGAPDTMAHVAALSITYGF